MPQMSPLMWSNLFLTFTVLLVICLVKIYFSVNKNIKQDLMSTNKTSSTQINWSW